MPATLRKTTYNHWPQLKRRDSLDWCHWCGRRSNQLVEVFHLANAEHRRQPTCYLRVCDVCVVRLREFIDAEDVEAAS